MNLLKSVFKHALLGALLTSAALAQDARIVFEKSTESDAYVLLIEGVNPGTAADWKIQVSQNLTTWSDAGLSFTEGAGWEFVPPVGVSSLFFRAVNEKSLQKLSVHTL